MSNEVKQKGTELNGRGMEISFPFSPLEISRKNSIKFHLLKKLLVIAIICFLCLTVLLIIKQITVRENTELISGVIQSSQLNQFINSSINHQLIDSGEEKSKNESIDYPQQQHSTVNTSDTTSTTESTTSTPKILNHILATIVINSATVPNKDGFLDKTDSYVKCFVDDNYIGKTSVQKETLKPIWNYQIAYRMTLRPHSLIQFKLYDSDKYTSHEFLGEFHVTTSQLIADGVNGQQIHRDHGSGKLWFTITWKEVYQK